MSEEVGINFNNIQEVISYFNLIKFELNSFISSYKKFNNLLNFHQMYNSDKLYIHAFQKDLRVKRLDGYFSDVNQNSEYVLSNINFILGTFLEQYDEYYDFKENVLQEQDIKGFISDMLEERVYFPLEKYFEDTKQKINELNKVLFENVNDILQKCLTMPKGVFIITDNTFLKSWLTYDENITKNTELFKHSFTCNYLSLDNFQDIEDVSNLLTYNKTYIGTIDSNVRNILNNKHIEKTLVEEHIMSIHPSPEEFL